jgi:hypothetical protein
MFFSFRSDFAVRFLEALLSFELLVVDDVVVIVAAVDE